MYKIKITLANLILLSILMASTSQLLFSQTRTLSNFYVSENTQIGISSTLLFANSENAGRIGTAKTGNKGYIIFGPNSKWIGASNQQFIDGYAKVLHDNPFVFPIGEKGNYHPIAISGASHTSAAYFSRNPAKLSKKQIGKKAITSTTQSFQLTDKGYWAVEGDQPTSITLMWDHTMAVNKLAKEELTSLSIMGFRNGKWEVISSAVDKYTFDGSKHNAATNQQKSNFNNGSISTATEIVPNAYDYFTIGAIETANSELALEVYPNPVSPYLPITVAYELPADEEAILQVYTATGILVKEVPLKVDNGIVELSDITATSGVYTVRVILPKGNHLSEKLLVLRK